MNHNVASNRRLSISHIAKGLGLGMLLLSAIACDAGITLRPKVPTFSAQTQFGAAQPVAHTQARSESPAAFAPEPVSDFPSEPAPQASSGYSQQGGTNAASATLTPVGSRVQGRVSKGAPRYFALNLSIGDSLEFSMYVRRLQSDNPVVKFRLLEPDNVKLANQSNYVIAPTSEYERMSMKATAGQAGRHILKITSDHPAEFRVDIKAVNLAGM